LEVNEEGKEEATLGCLAHDMSNHNYLALSDYIWAHHYWFQSTSNAQLHGEISQATRLSGNASKLR